jgi:hypothetical protein
MVGWLVGCLIGRLLGKLVGKLVNWSAVCMLRWLVAQVVGWLADCSVFLVRCVIFLGTLSDLKRE